MVPERVKYFGAVLAGRCSLKKQRWKNSRKKSTGEVLSHAAAQKPSQSPTTFQGREFFAPVGLNLKNNPLSEIAGLLPRKGTKR